MTRSYQRLFADAAGRIQVFDKQTGRYFQKGEDGVAYERELYAFSDDEGVKRYDIEHALAAFESAAIPIVKRLGDKHSIDDFERAMLSWFIAINALRSPGALQECIRVYKILAPWLRENVFKDEEQARVYFKEVGGLPASRANER